MNENFLFFYKSSHGELHAGLPILMKVLSERKGLNAYFIYEDKAAFNDIPYFYKDLIEDKFKTLHINKKNIATLSLKLFSDKNYLMTCDLGHTKYTKTLSYIWPFSKVIFFQHAYALLDGKNFEAYRRRRNFNIMKVDGLDACFNGGHYDPVVIAHNNSELGYRKVQGFKSQNIIVAGNLGFKNDWTRKLRNTTEDLNKIKVSINKYKKMIFVPVRGVHEHYLSEQNSSSLLHSLDKIIAEFPQYLFIIKAHPRQNNIYEYAELEQKYSNCQLTSLSTITVSELSNLVISFWSSAIIDALAMKAPVIEFHRHHFHHNHLVMTKNRLVSIYHNSNLCPFYTDYEDLKTLLGNPDIWQEISNQQQHEFNSIFKKEYPKFVDNLMLVLNNFHFSIPNYTKKIFEFKKKIFEFTMKKSLTKTKSIVKKIMFT